MAPLLIVLVLLLVAALAWGVSRHQAAVSALVRVGALDERVNGLTTDLGAATDRATFADKAKAEADQRAAAADQRAAEQGRQADHAEAEAKRSTELAAEHAAQAQSAEQARDEARARAEQAEAARAEAERERDAAAAGSGRFPFEALWRLEVARIERLWRDRLSLFPGDESPLAANPHDVGACLKVLADASREESGVVIDLEWTVGFDLPAEKCVQLLHLGEELIASVRDAEGGELAVAGDEDRTMVFTLRATPEVELSPTLVGAFAKCGAQPEIGDGAIVLRVPDQVGPGTEATTGADESAPDGPAAGVTAGDEQDGTAGELPVTEEAVAEESTADGAGAEQQPAGDEAPTGDDPAPAAVAPELFPEHGFVTPPGIDDVADDEAAEIDLREAADTAGTAVTVEAAGAHPHS